MEGTRSARVGGPVQQRFTSRQTPPSYASRQDKQAGWCGGVKLGKQQNCTAFKFLRSRADGKTGIRGFTARLISLRLFLLCLGRQQMHYNFPPSDVFASTHNSVPVSHSRGKLCLDCPVKQCLFPMLLQRRPHRRNRMNEVRLMTMRLLQRVAVQLQCCASPLIGLGTQSTRASQRLQTCMCMHTSNLNRSGLWPKTAAWL